MPRARKFPAPALVLAALCWAVPPFAGAARAGDVLTLPSGLTASLQEIIWDQDMETARFRFIAGDLPAAMDARALLESDLMALCEAFAAPLTRALQPGWTQVVLSLATEATEFGQDDPGIPQIFEGFDLHGRACTWGAF